MELHEALADRRPGLAEPRRDMDQPHVPAPGVVAGTGAHPAEHAQAAFAVAAPREQGLGALTIRMVEQDDRAARRQADPMQFSSAPDKQD